MIRKGKGKKTFNREKRLFSNTKQGSTPTETLHFKVISMSTRDLKNIVQNPDTVDLLTLSFAKEELDRRNFNQKNNKTFGSYRKGTAIEAVSTFDTIKLEK